MTRSLLHTEELLTRLQEPLSDEDVLQLAEQLRLLSGADVKAVIHAADLLMQRAAPAGRARIRALAARANALCYANEFEQALSDLEDACRLSDRAHADELPMLLLSRIQPLARLGRLRDAEDSARRAAFLFHRAGNAIQAAKATANLGIVLRMLGRHTEAIDRFRDSLAALTNDAPSVAALQSNLAEAYLELDRFAEALQSYQQARSILAGTAHVHAAAIVEGNLAELVGRMGRIDEAILAFEAARKAYKDAGAQGDAARLTAEEAEILLTAGATRRGLRLLEQSIPLLESAGMAREAARAGICLSVALLREGSVAHAIRTVERAARLAGDSGAEVCTYEAMIAKAEALHSTGEHDQALEIIGEIVARCPQRPGLQARAYMLQAVALLAMGGPDRAWHAAEAAHVCLGEHPLAPLRSRLLHVRGMVLAAQGKRSEAVAMYLEAIRTAESFRGSIRAETMRLASHEAAHDLYVHAVETVLDHGADDSIGTAFSIIERTQARMILERCLASQGIGALASNAAPLDADLARTRETLNALYSRQWLGTQGSEVDTHGARQRLARAEAEYERLLDRQGAEGLLDPLTAQPVSLEEARERLPEGCIIAELFRDGPSVSLMRIDRRSAVIRRRLLTHAELGARCRRLELLAERAIMGIGAHAGDAWRRALLELRDAVLPPGDDCIARASRMILIPFGLLSRVPLHLEPVIRGDGRRIEYFTPSLSVGLRLPAVTTQDPRVVSVGVADAVAPLMEDEASRVASCWRGADVFLGSDARAEDVLGAIVHADVIHLACHCVFDDEFPLSSRMLLGDRWVTARELCARFKPGVLVVLAGCESGREGGAESEQLGLKYAVLGAGASGVITVPWPVHDAVAVQLFESIHRSIATLDGPIILRAAQAIAMQQRRLHAAGVPFHTWAGLSVTGAIQ